MKAIKPVVLKKAPKKERQYKILLGLVSYYLKTGKAVGSETLKDAGFPDVSSATIRNYFVNLEDEGFLKQHHTSAGRIPTDKAFRLFAQACIDEEDLKKKEIKPSHHFEVDEPSEVQEVVLYLQKMLHTVSNASLSAAFLSAPRFDQDFVTDIKLVALDGDRYLSILVTNFGLIHTEILHASKKLSAFSIKRIESYFRSRLTIAERMQEELSKEELEIAHRFYQEAMARYLVNYTNFSKDEIIKEGFSKLLRYPEFQEAQALASSLSIFENEIALNALIRECMKSEKLKYWIGDDLNPYLRGNPNCAVLAVPYKIGNKIVGSLGIIGPMRMPYGEEISLLIEASDAISISLTRALYKYHITYRSATHSKEIESAPSVLALPKHVDTKESYGR